MSTRSTITVKIGEQYKSIYCHWDGYPSHQLPILREYYNTQEKAEALIALGNLSYLDKSIECPEGHTFETRVPGYCLAYGRDRGEKNQQAKTVWCNNLHCLRREDYNYLFSEGEWEII